MCLFVHFPGLSVLAAAMANKGTFNGVEVLSETEWEAMHDKPKEGKLFGAFSTNFTQGGVNIYKQASVDRSGRAGYVGWMGFGGSVFQWHHDLKIGFAYVPTLLDWTDLNNSKALRLQECLVECVLAKRSPIQINI